jgi:hypothetical protein
MLRFLIYFSLGILVIRALRKVLSPSQTASSKKENTWGDDVAWRGNHETPEDAEFEVVDDETDDSGASR